MAIIAKDAQKEYLPAPEGLHQGVCVDVVDVGLKSTPWGDKHKVDLRWQIDQINPETDKHFIVMKRYTLSLSEKATLRQHLEAWRGRRFTAEELAGFDLEKLIGVNCQLQIVHELSDQGKIFSNVQAIVPLGKGMTKMPVMDDYVRQCDREPKTDSGTPVSEDADAVPF